VLAASGEPYLEALDTERYDLGGTAQAVLRDRYVLTVRGAAAWQRYDHVFGDVVERGIRSCVPSRVLTADGPWTRGRRSTGARSTAACAWSSERPT
jgi:hypothetical protein